MGGNQLREVLNRLRWDPASTGEGVRLRYTSRIAGEDRELEVAFSQVGDILPEGVELANGTFLPYHRLVAVTRGREVLWRTAGEEL